MEAGARGSGKGGEKPHSKTAGAGCHIYFPVRLSQKGGIGENQGGQHVCGPLCEGAAQNRIA